MLTHEFNGPGERYVDKYVFSVDKCAFTVEKPAFASRKTKYQNY
jgi:hypothetical protein